MTVNLDAGILQLAEQEAKARHTTVREIVAHQVRVMARNWQNSRAGKTPITDALRGSVKLPPDFDERAALTEELMKKLRHLRLEQVFPGLNVHCFRH